MWKREDSLATVEVPSLNGSTLSGAVSGTLSYRYALGVFSEGIRRSERSAAVSPAPVQLDRPISQRRTRGATLRERIRCKSNGYREIPAEVSFHFEPPSSAIRPYAARISSANKEYSRAKFPGVSRTSLTGGTNLFARGVWRSGNLLFAFAVAGVCGTRLIRDFFAHTP